MEVPKRADAVARAAEELSKFIKSIGISNREFARVAGVPEGTLRLLLGNASASASSRRHKRAPYTRTLNRILKLNVPAQLRKAVHEVVDFHAVVKRSLRRSRK